VLVRDPVSYVGSWRKLGWSPAVESWLEQPALVRDLLGEQVPRLRAIAASSDREERIAGFWRAAYAVADRHFRDVPGLRVVRYEDLAADPQPAYRELFDTLGLTWSDQARDRIAAATTGRAPKRAFSWSLRGGPSRTAFQPMDSRAAAARAQARVEPDVVARVWEQAGEVAARFGYREEG
jgi:hypothetical protein